VNQYKNNKVSHVETHSLDNSVTGIKLILSKLLLAGDDEYGLHKFDPLPIKDPLSFEHNTRLIGGHMHVQNMVTEGLTTIKLLSLR